MSFSRLLVRSQDRTSTSTSSANFLIQLTQPFGEGYYSLDHVILPNAFYNVSSNNNKIYYKDNSDVDQVATITASVYTGASLATYLASLSPFNGATLSASTNKLTLTSASAITLTPNGNTQGSANSAAKVIGFTATTAKLASLVGDSVINLTYPNSVAISIGTTSGYLTASPTVAGSFFIPVDVNSLSVVYWYAKTRYEQKVYIPAATNFQVQLKDTSGAALSMNGVDWEFSISKVDA